VAAGADFVDAASLFMSAISILEIKMGTLSLDRRDARQASFLFAGNASISMLWPK
jgi:hypothetical protein